MSNIPISSLPIAISLSGSEAVVMDQAGTTKTATVSLINAQNVANIPTGGTTGQALVKSSGVNYATMWKTASGLGTVQEVDTGTGLTGGPITLTGTVSLAPITSQTLLANITGGSAAPIPNTTSSVLDFIGSTQGDILYRDSAGWQVLPPGTTGQILKTQGAAANPIWSATGSGSVTSVALSLPSIITVSGSPVTVSGTLTGTLATQNANLVWAGPTTGAAATPTFRSLVGADLPNPAATTLGGIQSTTGTTHQWISSISTLGVPGLTQPAFTDISGVATGAQLPNPSASTLGGVQSFAAVTSKWINQISTSGVPSATQPLFSDISGSIASSQLPTIGNNTIISNISGGSSSGLPNTLSAIIDSGIASTQGDILYRDSGAWLALAPGTNGQVLTTGGAAANPAWTTVTGTGTVTSVATNNGLTGGAITTTGTIGLATIASNRILANVTGGAAIPIANTMSAILDIVGATEGDILYRGASTWAALAPGTSGQFLQTPGAGSTPSWAAAITSISAGSGISATPSGSTVTVAQSLTNVSLMATVASPTATTSAPGVMMGMGSACHMTPAYSTRLMVTFSGYINSNTSVLAETQFRYGTGTAPINGAALTGTAVGSLQFAVPITSGTTSIPYSKTVVITGLTPLTAYWFDMSLSSNNGVSVSMLNNDCAGHEF